MADAIQGISVLDKNVVESVGRFLKLIHLLVEVNDMVKKRMRGNRGGGGMARLDVFGKAKSDGFFLIQGHVFNEFPNPRISFEELNVFER